MPARSPVEASHGSPPKADPRDSRLERWWPWLLRTVWAALAFTVGPVIGSALAERSRAVQLVAISIAWAVWTLGLMATVVAHPVGLTASRLAAPAVVIVALWASVAGHLVAWRWAVALVVSVVALALVGSARTGEWGVGGPSYPNESRFPLRAPATLAAIVPVIGTLVIAGVVTGPLLLAARSWVPGVLATVAGVAIAVTGVRSLHQLHRRFVVFVPAGFVLHDHLSIAEPVLFRRTQVESIGLASAASDSLDLTAKAPGLAVEVRLREKVEVARVAGDLRTAEAGATTRFLVMPSRPGRVLAEARRRRYDVGGTLAPFSPVGVTSEVVD